MSFRQPLKYVINSIRINAQGSDGSSSAAHTFDDIGSLMERFKRSGQTSEYIAFFVQSIQNTGLLPYTCLHVY